MSDAPILTIGIPTYNRAHYLTNLLDGICRELAAGRFDGQIEILISDNASADNTREVVQQYRDEFPISYYRNSTNITSIVTS